jgi:hypothetical protein
VEHKLNSDLQPLVRWSENYRMVVNTEKTKTMVIGIKFKVRGNLNLDLYGFNEQRCPFLGDINEQNTQNF